MGHFDYRPSYRRNLPHVQPPGATFFVTFRLAGSLPQNVILQWERQRKALAQLADTNPSLHQRRKQEFERVWFAKFESILDGGRYGPQWLGDERIAARVANRLHDQDGRFYRLDSFSIMPNHVHVVFKPLPVTQTVSLRKREVLPVCEVTYHSLASIMQSLKGYTAFEANRLLGRDGEFWAHESYDHYIRDAEEWQRIQKYVTNNPVKAGYVGDWREWKWNYRRV